MDRVISTLKRHYILGIVILFFIILLGAYAAGFRPGPGLTLVRVGTLVVTDIPAGTNVYTDQASRGTSTGNSLSTYLVPGNHTVIVDVAGQEPWEKIIMIGSNQTTTVSPILVPLKPAAKPLSGTDAAAAASALAATKLPTEAAPLMLGCANVYVSDNRVIASAATTTGCTAPEYLCTAGSCAPTIVYSPVAMLHSVIAYPGRTDAIIVATGEWVYVLGLDPRNPQFFAPVTHGTAPSLAASSTSSLYMSNFGHPYLYNF